MRTISLLMLLVALGTCGGPAMRAQAGELRPASKPKYQAVARPMAPGEMPEGHAQITGTVSYGAQMPPPVGAELDLTLEDVSLSPAHVISVSSASSSTSPPREFDLTYDSSVLKVNHRYVIRARVLVGDEVLFVSEKSYSVLGAANITHVDMLMRRATPAENTAPDRSTQLENNSWRLVTLGEDKVAAPEGVRAAYFVMQSGSHRVSGYSGCNDMTGSYTLKGAQLTFGQVGGTMMACMDGMELEQKFHLMFPRVAAWRIDGETLQLLDGAGTVLATFESLYSH